VIPDHTPALSGGPDYLYGTVVLSAWTTGWQQSYSVLWVPRSISDCGRCWFFH